MMRILGHIMWETDTLIIGIGTEEDEEDIREWHFIPSYADDHDFLCALSEVMECAKIQA